MKGIQNYVFKLGKFMEEKYKIYLHLLCMRIWVHTPVSRNPSAVHKEGERI